MTSLKRIAYIFALSIAASGLAQERTGGPEFRAVCNALACQCGCNQTIANCSMEKCHSSLPIREEVKERLNRGESLNQILKAFQDRYGPIILSAPPASGFYLTAWIVPFVTLGIGALATRQVLRSWRRQSRNSAPRPPGLTINDAQRKQIEKELRDLL